jgi:hypothetical protein
MLRFINARNPAVLAIIRGVSGAGVFTARDDELGPSVPIQVQDRRENRIQR